MLLGTVIVKKRVERRNDLRKVGRGKEERFRAWERTRCKLETMFGRKVD